MMSATKCITVARVASCIIITAVILSAWSAPSHALDLTRFTVFMKFSLPNDLYLVPVQVLGESDMEQALMEMLSGPSAHGPLEPLLPPGTELIGIDIIDGVAYVNLNDKATTANVGGRGDELIVAGIVNSLARFPGVERVQILIEGEIREAIWGHVDTSQPITPDLSLMFTGFEDVRGHWAEGQILAYCLQGTIAGYPDGNFHPSRMVTRAEFIKILVGALGVETEPSASNQTFTDVPPSHWAHPYVEAAVAQGFIVPADYGASFGPGTELKRQEMAVILVRAADLEHRAQELSGTTLSFTDTTDLPGWATGYIAAANEKQLLLGYPDNTFRPQGTTTRAETAVVVGRISHMTNNLISVGWPVPGMTTSDRMLISGAAKVFEATLLVRFLGDSDEVLHSDWITATTGGPDWGLFATYIPVPADAVAVEVYWSSPKDGSDCDVVRIPVTR